MTSQQAPGGYWSAANPIPTIKDLVENLDVDKKERDKQIDEQERIKRQHEKQRHHGDVEAVPHKRGPEAKLRRRTVTDPTTRKEVEIDDVGREYMEAVKSPQISVPNANLGLPTPFKTDPSQEYRKYKETQDMTAPPDPVADGTTSDMPIHGEKTNILFHPTPSISFEPMFKVVEQRAGMVCVGIFFAILVSGRLAGGTVKGHLLLAAGVVSAVWLWMKDVVRRGRSFEWNTERLRGRTATANLLPESVEWINSFMEVLWGLLDPDMFASIGSTIEDVMQASVPGIIENVRVAEIDQGSNPIRILSLRSLPDGESQDLVESMRNYHREQKDEQEVAATEEGGGFYNVECSFAYHAKPGYTSSHKAKNMHMLLIFYLGVKGLFGVPLPIFSELIEVVGTVRLRIHLTPQFPFAKNVTFSLMGLPHVRAGCTPMFRTGVNVLNLPVISNFVNYAINAAASIYVAPKSMTLDLEAMLKGDDIQKDTLAMGVVWVNIKKAVDLSKQDTRGSYGGGSDAYINLSFSKYGKPMYCTRIICDDLNPVWNESAALLVTPELIKANEQLSVELWDSDRNTADDIVGKVEIPMQKMIQQPGKMYPIVSPLQGLQAGTEMPGHLHWEVGYFTKPRFRPSLRTDGRDPNLPENMKDEPALQDDKCYQVSHDEHPPSTHTPPDPIWPSGVCTVVIHQIVNLQLASNKGTLNNRKHNEYGPAREYGENTDEAGKSLPTSYCTILLNDQLIYRTRAKAVSSKPVFSAGTERFIRDWRSTVITITVRDQRYREHDPILGVVPLKLSDILQTRSQVTRWYPLDGGVGFGRMRVSLLFRSVELKLPPQLLGWSVGTFEVISDQVTVRNYGNHHTKLRMRTSGAATSLPRSTCRRNEDKNGLRFDINTEALKRKCRLPVKFRYRSAIIFELNGGTPAYAVLWLQHLIDNDESSIDIPIWKTKNAERLTQNYITEENWEEKRSPGLEDLTEVGRLQFTGRFLPGMDEAHQSVVYDNSSRETYESWEECVAEGVRDRHVSIELPEAVKEFHRDSLFQQRDIFRQVPPEERKRILDNDDELDWSSLFGDNTGAMNPEASSHPGQDAHRDTGAAEHESENHDSGVSLAGPADNNSRKRGSDSVENQSNRPMSHGARTDDSPNTDAHNAGEEQQDNESSSSIAESATTAAESERPEDREARIGKEANKRSEHRKQRGMMQWRRARNVSFAKDEANYAMKKMRRKVFGDLRGREPDIETET